jgi:hypothetical protein
VIITAGRREVQLCWSERWTGFSARTGSPTSQLRCSQPRMGFSARTGPDGRKVPAQLFLGERQVDGMQDLAHHSNLMR